MTNNDVVKVVRTAPDLWIERVVIFDDVSTKSVLREISFCRGLNIIYGISEVSDLTSAPDDGFLIGHSVGKSSLCRLIRYGLGEDTFGQEDSVKQIQGHFPRGAIGISVHVKGTEWSIVRMFQGGNARSYASDTQSIEDLAGQRKLSHIDYGRFREALQESFVKDVPGFTQNGDFKWRDLLAWMARDQEARYESLWKWRDKRSNSPSGLDKSSALRLIGNILGIFSEKTNRLIRQRENLEFENNRLNDAIAAHNRRRTSDVASYDADINLILGKYGIANEIPDNLFDVDGAIRSCRDAILQITEGVSKQRGDLAWQLHGHQIDKRRIDEEIATIRRHFSISKDIVEDKKRDDDELEQVKGDKCDFGGILFAQCNFFMDKLNRRRDDFMRRLQDDAAADNSDEYRQRMEQLIADEFNLRGALQTAQAGIRKLERDLNAFDNQIRELSFDADRLIRLNAAKAQISGDAPQVQVANEIASRLGALSKELSEALLLQSEANVELHALFDRLVRFIFSNQYTGKIIARGKDEPLQFSLVGKRGEAVATLTSVLADLAAMLLSVEGHGYHPRFLIHDSPREADLAASAYGTFLAKVHALATELGGEEAPFQYIITTTTKPPSQLDSCIRLRLCGYPEEDLLFKKNIDADLNEVMDLAGEVQD